MILARRANRVLLACTVGVGALAGVILHLFPPEHSAFYPRCLFHSWTGLHCPGCGSLRAVSALARGELSAALHSNILLTLSLPFAAVLLALRRWRHGDWSIAAWIPAWGWWVALGLTIVFGLVRNLPGTPFDALRP